MNLLYYILILPGYCCNILHAVKKNLEAFLISESSGQHEYYCARGLCEALCTHDHI